MSKEVRKKNATIVNIHIRSPFYVMYFYLYNYNSPLQLYRTSNIHLYTCALERLMLRCGEAGTGLSMAEENVLYSATLDMSNGVTIIVTHSWWPKYKKR